MKTYEQALAEVRFSRVISGGVAYVDGKELTGKNGYWYLDGELVTNIPAFLELVEVDPKEVERVMAE